MEPQVLVCSEEVAAFVDALETIGYPVVHPVTVSDEQTNAVEEDEGAVIHNETYILETNDVPHRPDSGHTPTKRYRTNPKQQKEVIEMLFEKQKAVVTEKAFMNLKGNKRFKSDVWSWFGDIKLLISRSEARKLKIPFYYRMCGEERMMLSKLFVGCFRCNALFIHNSQRSGTSTLRAHMRVCSRPRSRKKKGAPTIIFFPSKGTRSATRIASDSDKLMAQEHVLDFILGSDSAFDLLEATEFQQLLQMCISIGANYGDINVESMLCPQEKLSEFLLNDLYVSSISAFYTEFQYSYGAAFSTNIWVDEQQKNSYISVLCHYCNSSGELKNVILHTDEFNCAAKAPEDACDSFNTLLSEMAVSPIKRLVVTDNLSNIVAAFKDEECIRCMYQNLNLAVQVVLQVAMRTDQSESTDFATLISGCKDIILYFEQISSEYPLPEPLKMYKEDSWTSILNMLRSIYNQYEDILNILNDTGDTHLLSVEKAVVSAVIDVFQVFEEGLAEFCNSAEPTLNMVIPWIAKLRKYCIIEAGDLPIVQQLKIIISSEVNDRLTSNVTIYHRIATMLDPRFKRMVFLPREDQVAATMKLKFLVKESMEAPLLDDFNERFMGDNSSREQYPDLYGSNITGDSENNEKIANQEVDNFLVEQFNPPNEGLGQQQTFDLLKFWVQNNDRLSNLYKVALWILSCPASCVQTEESFWTNDWLVNCCRVHQKPEHVNKVLFVKSFKSM